MYAGEHADRIDELVQASPAPAAEAADHAVCRGRCARDLPDVESMIGRIQAEMNHRINKGGNADHPPHYERTGAVEE